MAQAISYPKDLYERLMSYAGDNDDSLSYKVAKMSEIGLMITENKNEIKSPEDRFSKIEQHYFTGPSAQ